MLPPSVRRWSPDLPGGDEPHDVFLFASGRDTQSLCVIESVATVAKCKNTKCRRDLTHIFPSFCFLERVRKRRPVLQTMSSSRLTSQPTAMISFASRGSPARCVSSYAWTADPSIHWSSLHSGSASRRPKRSELWHMLHETIPFNYSCLVPCFLCTDVVRG